MRLPKATSLTTRIKHAALAFDAWVNASLYDGGRTAGETYERFQERMNVFSVRGWKRGALDLTSEAMTLGTGAWAGPTILTSPAPRREVSLRGKPVVGLVACRRRP